MNNRNSNIWQWRCYLATSFELNISTEGSCHDNAWRIIEPTVIILYPCRYRYLNCNDKMSLDVANVKYLILTI